MIRVAESVAREILEEARFNGDRIRRETEETLGEVYREAYAEAIAEAERRSMELVKEAKEKAEREAKETLRMADKEIEEIRERARKNFDVAVDLILNELTS